VQTKIIFLNPFYNNLANKLLKLLKKLYKKYAKIKEKNQYKTVHMDNLVIK